MKFLVIVLVVISAHCAQAESFTIKSDALVEIKQSFNVLKDFHHRLNSLKGYKLEVLASESISISLKDSIEAKYSDHYSSPEYVDILKLRKKVIDEELEMILEPVLVYAGLQYKSEQVQEIIMKLSHLTSFHNSLMIFSLNQGNMFGEGVGLIFYDQNTDESFVIERLYQE